MGEGVPREARNHTVRISLQVLDQDFQPLCTYQPLAVADTQWFVTGVLSPARMVPRCMWPDMKQIVNKYTDRQSKKVSLY